MWHLFQTYEELPNKTIYLWIFLTIVVTYVFSLNEVKRRGVNSREIPIGVSFVSVAISCLFGAGFLHITSLVVISIICAWFFIRKFDV